MREENQYIPLTLTLSLWERELHQTYLDSG